MAGNTISQSNLPTDANLKDVLDLWKRDIMMSLSAHHIGTIQSFNATNQTATATINYKKTYFRFNQTTKKYDAQLVDYPLVADCPVIILGGGDASLTFPISQGDECLILFNDRDIDNWFASGGGGGVATPRMHNFSDGIILVGLRSLRRSLSDYDQSRAVLQNGNAMVAVGSDLIKIANNLYDLKTLLQNLITQIAAITVTGVSSGGSTSGPPVNAAAITAISTQIASLLE